MRRPAILLITKEPYEEHILIIFIIFNYCYILLVLINIPLRHTHRIPTYNIYLPSCSMSTLHCSFQKKEKERKRERERMID